VSARGFLHVFRNLLRPVPNLITCSPSPNAREPISVVITFYQLRKKGAVMQKANVSHDMTKMGKMVRRKKLPWVRRSKTMYTISRSWCGIKCRWSINVDGKKKSDEEAKKKQRIGLTAKGRLCSESGVRIPLEVGLQVSQCVNPTLPSRQFDGVPTFP
jgi:hypothetical protein